MQLIVHTLQQTAKTTEKKNKCQRLQKYALRLQTIWTPRILEFLLMLHMQILNLQEEKKSLAQSLTLLRRLLAFKAVQETLGLQIMK